MPPPTADTDATLAVVASRLSDVREDIAQLRGDLAANRVEMVSRGEWMMRNQAVDARFEGQGREISDLKQAHAATRAPWWSWASVLIAVGALAWNVLGPVLTHGVR